MKFFVAQLRRDLGDWWLLFGAAILAGMFPLLLPIVYATEGEESVELRLATAIAGTLLYGLATLAMLGDGLAARDIAEGRFGFYLARPMPTSSLWAARLTAAVLLFVLVVAALAVPTWLVTSAQDPAAGSRASLASMVVRVAVTAPGITLDRIFEPTGHHALFGVLGAFGAIGLVLSLLLLAHGASTSGRSRSLWTLLDLFGMAALVIVWLEIHDTLVSVTAFGALVAAERLFVMALTAALLIAGYRQLAHGRSDLVRGHGVFSRTLWPLLAAVVLCLFGWARWTASPEADDLVSAEHLWTATDGRLLAVEGEAAHRLGLRTSVLFPAGRALGRVTALASAREADVAAWIRCRRWTRADCGLWTWRLDDPDGPLDTGVHIDRWDPEVAVSPYGQLVAVTTDRLEVWQPDIPKLVFARDLPGRRFERPTFLSSTRLRYLHVDYDEELTSLEEVDLSSGAVQVLAELPGDALEHHFRMSASGRLVAMGAMLPPRLLVVDTASGASRDLRHPDASGDDASGDDASGDEASDDEASGDEASTPLARSEILLAAHFVGEDLALLVRSASGEQGLIRVQVNPFAGEEAAVELRIDVEELPLPPALSAPGTALRMAPYGTGILLSGTTAVSGPGTAALPEGVEPLPGVVTYFLDLSSTGPISSEAEPRWSRLAAGLMLPGWGRLRPADPMDVERSAAFLFAGGGAILRLEDDALRVVVPALPDTDVGSLVAYGKADD